MKKDKALKLIGKFWLWVDQPKQDCVGGGIYWITTFIEWLYDEGHEIKEKP